MFNKYRLTAAMYIGINSDVSLCIDKMLLLMLLADFHTKTIIVSK